MCPNISLLVYIHTPYYIVFVYFFQNNEYACPNFQLYNMYSWKLL